MASTRDIRRRIRSVKNTAQITRAMQLVAASKMKRAQDNAKSGRPYAQLMAEILEAIGSHVSEDELKHPFFEKREVKKRGILVVTTEKGLCGSLNANIFRLITEIGQNEARFISIGRKGTQFISRTNRELMADFSVSDHTRFYEVRPVVELLIKAYLEGEIDTIEVLYPFFVNNLKQDPKRIELVPVDGLGEFLKNKPDDQGYTESPPIKEDSRELKFEPDAKAILAELLNLFVKREIYHMVLEAKASEHSARMVAMKTATDNANELVDDLSLQYNKVRQASITQEILEISAANAT